MMITTPTIQLNDGNTMPQLGLGVWKAVDGQEVENAVSSAIEAGYRLIDTAAVYQNEQGVGNAIAASKVPREELFVTTKLWNSDQATRADVRAAFMKSLSKLQLGYIDLYLIHWPMPAKKLYIEAWKELEKLKSEGLIRSIGVSNFRIEDLQELEQATDTIPAINQIELHPYFSQTELRDYCQKKDIQVESWSPIGGGKSSLLTDAEVASIAEKYNKSAAQIVIRWHIQNNLVVIPKSTNSTRIQQNIDVFDFELSKQDMEQIDSLNIDKRQGPDPATMNIA